MSTCSSSPRSNEPALPCTEPAGPAQPSDETAVGTGTHPVDQADAPPAAGERPATPCDPVSDPVRAAVTDRPLGDAVDLELVGLLFDERREHTEPPANEAAPAVEAEGQEPEAGGGRVRIRVARVVPVRGSRRTRSTGRGACVGVPERAIGSAPWGSWLTAVALAVCAVAHFPLHRDGASLRVHAIALGLSVLCTVLALLLAVRPAALVLAVAVVVPAVLVMARVYGSAFPSTGVFRAVELALAPPWFAAASAVCASLLALTAFVVRVASPFPGRRWAAWPAPEARHIAE